MQTGSIRKRHGAWHLRFYVEEIGPDGQPRRRQITKKLAKVCDEYRSKKDLDSLVMAELARVNRGDAAEGSLTVSEFTERFFLPWITAHKKPSTVKFYRDTIDNHVTARVGHVRLREFNARHAQNVLDAAASLSHQSCLRIKTSMSALFSYAIRCGYVMGANPCRETKAEGTRSKFVGHAYTLKEIEHMLAHLDEPARTVVGLAAFSGLRESEIRGLRWDDYDGLFLHVRRSVWRTAVSENAKTGASEATVPVIEPLRKMLDAHKRRNGAGPWIFAGGKLNRPLNLANVARRDILPAIGAEKWKGWHAFRRGLATNLYNLGVKPEVAQVILRHADASTTRRHYIMLESKKQGAAAMRKLERLVESSGPVRANRGPTKKQKSRQPA
jgi:integrase